MKRKRRIFGKVVIGFFLTVFILIAGVVLLVYFNRDKIAAQLKEEINNSINAKFDFEAVGLSLRHFPSLGLCLEDFSLVGVKEFSYDTLVSGSRLDVAISLKSLLRSSDRTIIQNVHFDQPHVRLVVLEDGRANYDIAKKSELDDTTSIQDTTAVHIELSQYSLRGANILYDDRQEGLKISLIGLDHRGSGDFTLDEFDLDMLSMAKSLSLDYGGVNYLKNVRLNLDNTLHINLNTSRYELGETALKLNALKLLLDGYVQLVGDSILYAFDFSAPGNEFRELLSILPNAYTDNFNQLKANGSFSLNGSFSSKGQDFPAFDISAAVNNASFQYPDLPMGFSDIQISAQVRNPGTIADATFVDVRSLSWMLGDRPFDASFVLKTPVSNPDFDGRAEGSIDLATMQKAFPMEGVEELSGLVTVDLEGKAKMSDIEAGNYSAVTLSGDLTTNNLRYRAKGEPLLAVDNATVNVSPEKITIPAIAGKYGSSDFTGSAELQNGLLLFAGTGDINGNITLRSRYLDLNPFLVTEESTKEASGSTVVAGTVPEMYENIQLDLDLNVDTLIYGDYRFYSSTGHGSLSGQSLQIRDLESLYEGQSLDLRGGLDNIWNYVYLSQPLRANLQLNAGTLDLNPFLDYEEDAESEEVEDAADAYSVPKEYDFDISVSAKKLLFQKYELNNCTGLLVIQNGVVELKNLRSGFLGGNLVLNGTYDTSDPANPLAKLSYNVDQLEFQPTFNAVNSFAALAPVAKFIEGKFNSNFSLETRLTSDLNPVLSSIDAQGIFHTLKGEIAGFPPLEKVASFLQLDALKKLNFSETRNKFQVVDGTVFIEPFTIKKGDISMQISGQHSLDQQIDYKILMELPFNMIRDKLDLGKPLAAVREQANKLGIDLKEGIKVNLLVGLTGSIQDPKPSVKLLTNIEEDIIGSAKEQLAAKIDSLKEVGKQKVDSVKAVIQEKVEEKKEELVAEVNKQITNIRAQAQNTSDQLVAQATKSAEQIRTEGYAQADNLVEAAGNDPLRKLAAVNAADRIRKETDKKADQIIQKAESEAQNIMQQAEARADSLRRTIE